MLRERFCGDAGAVSAEGLAAHAVKNRTGTQNIRCKYLLPRIARAGADAERIRTEMILVLLAQQAGIRRC